MCTITNTIKLSKYTIIIIMRKNNLTFYYQVGFVPDARIASLHLLDMNPGTKHVVDQLWEVQEPTAQPQHHHRHRHHNIHFATADGRYNIKFMKTFSNWIITVLICWGPVNFGTLACKAFSKMSINFQYNIQNILYSKKCIKVKNRPKWANRPRFCILHVRNYAGLKKYATAVILAMARILNTPLLRFPALEDFFSQDFLLVLARWNKICCQLFFMDL